MLPLTRFRKRTRFFGVSGPSFALDFANNGPFDPRITFSRASSATLFDSSGTLVYAPMNLLLQSEDFATTWVSAAPYSVSTDTEIAPDGLQTADSLIVASGQSAFSTQVTRQVVSKEASAIRYTRSTFFKALGATTSVRLSDFGSITASNASTTISLIDGSVITSPFAQGSFSDPSVAVFDAGNGWWRVSFTYTTDTHTSLTVRSFPYVGGSALIGDGTSGLYIWGAQLNIANMQGGVTADLSTYYPTTTAAYQGPRLDYDPATLAARGLLIEEQRTNSIRNNTMVGAVAGTPGTLPTNWAATVPAANVIGTGTENGITYIDVQVVGTAGATTGNLAFDTITAIAAASGQTWTHSVYIRLVAGSFTNVTQIRVNMQGYTSASASTADSFSSGNIISSLSATNIANNRQPLTGTLADATTAYIRPRLFINWTNGAAVDFTLRIGLPQLELGAFETSVIPTTTTALTRSADVASVNTLSPWFNAAASTLYAEVLLANLPAVSTFPVYAAFNDGSTVNNTIHLSSNSFANHRVSVRSGGASLWDVNAGGSIVAGTPSKWALAVASGSQAACANGGSVATNSTAGLPTGLSRLGIGSQYPGAGQSTAWIRRITYYPRKLSSAELAAITT